MKLVRVTATSGTTSPVTLDEAKEYLRITSEQEGRSLQTALDAAVDFCQRTIPGHIQLCNCTYQVLSSGFPDDDQRWEIPVPPLVSSTAITINYYNSTNGYSTLSSTTWDAVVPTEGPAFVKAKTNETWPTTRERPDAVTLQFKAGFGPPRKVPATIKMAVLMKTEHLWDPTRFDPRADVDQAIESLLGCYDYGRYS
jgi:hypothetical protein